MRVLALAGDRAAARGVDTIDPMLTHARFWAGAEGERTLVASLVELVLADPARPGPALVLGGLAARTRRQALARAAYSLPAFVQPDGLGAKLLEALPVAEAVRVEAVRPGTPVDHPDVAGPVRRALSRLAPALLGLDYDQPAPKPVEGSGLPPARAIELRRIADLLGAPAFVVAPDAEGLRRTPSPQGERRRLRLIPSQPAGLLISPAAVMLGLQAWSFVAGRAIEALRSGLVTAGLTGVDGLARLLEGARAALGGAPSDRAARRRRRRLAATPRGDGDARIARGAGGAPGRRRGGAGGSPRLADVPPRHPPHLQPDRPAGLRQPGRRAQVVSEGELFGDDDEPPTAAIRARVPARRVGARDHQLHVLARVRSGGRDLAVRAFLCSAGSEPALAEELARAGATAAVLAPGVVAGDRCDDRFVDELVVDPIFARQALPEARVVEGSSVRALAEAIFAALEPAIDRWPGPFVVHALAHAEPPPGLASRATLVAREALALFAARRRRAFRRQRTIEEAETAADGFDETWLLVQIVALGRDRFVVSAAAPRPLPAGGLDLARWPGGDAPVAIDRAPPSRAYQKLEEAFAWMAAAPRAGETCVDLGAAPGGWTATAVKRGARVVAVDRAPLAPPLGRNPLVASVIGNAFNYRPRRAGRLAASATSCASHRAAWRSATAGSPAVSAGTWWSR